MLTFDFNIETSAERTEYVNKFFRDNPDATLPPNQLEAISNYIIYGKDAPGGTNAVQRHEIEIKPKYTSYSRNYAATPLDADQLAVMRGHHIVNYRGDPYELLPRQSLAPKKVPIDRAADSDVAGLPQLWVAIDRLVDQIQRREAAGYPTYALKHLLIELRRDQYHLRDLSRQPTIINHLKSETSFWCADHEIINSIAVYPPRTTATANTDASSVAAGTTSATAVAIATTKSSTTSATAEPTMPSIFLMSKPTGEFLDFTNADHIRALYMFYLELDTFAAADCESTWHSILEQLNYYAAIAELNEIQRYILESKRARKTNPAIAREIEEKFQVSHSANYISTIWMTICRHIAETAAYDYEEYKDYCDPTKWKKCRVCHQLKHIDARNFTRRSRNADGFHNQCKDCEKKTRIKEEK